MGHIGGGRNLGMVYLGVDVKSRKEGERKAKSERRVKCIEGVVGLGTGSQDVVVVDQLNGGYGGECGKQ
jgi:hypothetical protein